MAPPRRGGDSRRGGRSLHRPGARGCGGGEAHLLRVPRHNAPLHSPTTWDPKPAARRLRHQHLHPVHRGGSHDSRVRRDGGRAARGGAVAERPRFRPGPDGKGVRCPGGPPPGEEGPPPLIPPNKEAPMDLIPTRDEILRGETTDIYFRRTMEVLRATGKDRVRVTAEAIVKKFPAVRVAEALRERLSAVRLDTPGSRRGDFRRILQEVRWELDLRGFRHVRLIASGGLGEEEVRALRDVADGFGVGTSLSNAPTIDYALDIVEVEGVPFAKRGKRSGRKQVDACEACGARTVRPAADPPGHCPCGGLREALLRAALRGGRPVEPPSAPRAIRDRVLRQVERFHAREAVSYTHLRAHETRHDLVC